MVETERHARLFRNGRNQAVPNRLLRPSPREDAKPGRHGEARPADGSILRWRPLVCAMWQRICFDTQTTARKALLKYPLGRTHASRKPVRGATPGTAHPGTAIETRLQHRHHPVPTLRWHPCASSPTSPILMSSRQSWTMLRHDRHRYHTQLEQPVISSPGANKPGQPLPDGSGCSAIRSTRREPIEHDLFRHTPAYLSAPFRTRHFLEFRGGRYFLRRLRHAVNNAYPPGLIGRYHDGGKRADAGIGDGDVEPTHIARHRDGGRHLVFDTDITGEMADGNIRRKFAQCDPALGTKLACASFTTR